MPLGGQAEQSNSLGGIKSDFPLSLLIRYSYVIADGDVEGCVRRLASLSLGCARVRARAC